MFHVFCCKKKLCTKKRRMFRLQVTALGIDNNNKKIKKKNWKKDTILLLLLFWVFICAIVKKIKSNFFVLFVGVFYLISEYLYALLLHFSFKYFSKKMFLIWSIKNWCRRFFLFAVSDITFVVKRNLNFRKYDFYFFLLSIQNFTPA